jgi:hypothetical protein
LHESSHCNFSIGTITTTYIIGAEYSLFFFPFGLWMTWIWLELLSPRLLRHFPSVLPTDWRISGPWFEHGFSASPVSSGVGLSLEPLEVILFLIIFRERDQASRGRSWLVSIMGSETFGCSCSCWWWAVQGFFLYRLWWTTYTQVHVELVKSFCYSGRIYHFRLFLRRDSRSRPVIGVKYSTSVIPQRSWTLWNLIGKRWALQKNSCPSGLGGQILSNGTWMYGLLVVDGLWTTVSVQNIGRIYIRVGSLPTRLTRATSAYMWSCNWRSSCPSSEINAGLRLETWFGWYEKGVLYHFFFLLEYMFAHLSRERNRSRTQDNVSTVYTNLVCELFSHKRMFDDLPFRATCKEALTAVDGEVICIEVGDGS